jgi:hypothetical protein
MILEPLTKASTSPARGELDKLWRAVRALTPQPFGNQTISRTSKGWTLTNSRKVSHVSSDSAADVKYQTARVGCVVGSGFVYDLLAANSLQGGGAGVMHWDLWRRLNGNIWRSDYAAEPFPAGLNSEHPYTNDFDPTRFHSYRSVFGVSNEFVDMWPVLFYTTQPEKPLNQNTIKAAWLPPISRAAMDNVQIGNEGGSITRDDLIKTIVDTTVGTDTGNDLPFNSGYWGFPMGVLPNMHWEVRADVTTPKPTTGPHAGQWNFSVTRSSAPMFAGWPWDADAPMSFRSIHEHGARECTKISVREGLKIECKSKAWAEIAGGTTWQPYYPLGPSRLHGVVEGFSTKRWGYTHL